MNILKKIYRLLNQKQLSNFVWSDLKLTIENEGYNNGVFETRKLIEIKFSNHDDIIYDYNVFLNEETQKLVIYTTIINAYHSDKSRDCLVLASHFNSKLNHGIVTVNPEGSSVSYFREVDLFTYCFFPERIIPFIESHYHTSNDVLWAFNKLLTTDEDPIFIFSELLRSKATESEDSSS